MSTLPIYTYNTYKQLFISHVLFYHHYQSCSYNSL